MEFEWDDGNLLKSLKKHGITTEESEQVFINKHLLRIDEQHSYIEVRFEIVGQTDFGKVLFIIFTTRKNKIRIISARMASKNERKLYHEE